MNDRVTLISIFNQNDLDKISSVVNKTSETLCKVPFVKGVDDRFSADTLPYHFTISAWDIEDEEYLLRELSKVNFDKFKILIDGLEITNGRDNSYVLLFRFLVTDELKLLQQKIYSILPTEKYNPEKFKFHITITIDKDYEKVIKIKDELARDFVPFEVEVDSIGLYEIYPANLVKKIEGN